MNTKRMADRIAGLVLTAWVGGTWAMGYLAAPVLFRQLPDRQLAGMVAGELFMLTAYMGIGCALVLLVYTVSRTGKQAIRNKVFWVIASMTVLTLAGPFWIQPILAGLKAQALPLAVMSSEYAGQFRVWHGASSVLYLLQSLLGGLLVIWMRGWPLQDTGSDGRT